MFGPYLNPPLAIEAHPLVSGIDRRRVRERTHGGTFGPPMKWFAKLVLTYAVRGFDRISPRDLGSVLIRRVDVRRRRGAVPMATKAGSAARGGITRRLRATKGATSSRKRRRSPKRSTKRPAKRPPWYVVALRAAAVLVAVVALGLFSYWAYRVTLTPIHDKGQAIGNTHPGRTLRFYLDRPSVKEALIQIGGNLVLLAPLGILLPVIFTKLRTVVRITLAAAAISLVIEAAQGFLVAGRAFDADDVILNTTGVLLAYLVAGRRVARIARGGR
jgi:VanZ like protein